MNRPAEPVDAAPVRVAFLDHCAKLSGAEIALLRLVPALREVDPVVVLGEDGPLQESLVAAGVRVGVLPLAGRTAALRRGSVGARLPLAAVVDVAGYVLRLRRLVRALDVDVIHTNSLKACLYGGVAGVTTGTPVFWHARDRYSADYLPAAAVRLVRLAARVLPSVVVANSATTLATLAPHPDPRRQPRIALPDPISAAQLAVGQRRLAGPPRSGPFTVGLLGRISPWKGQDVFLRAFAEAFPAAGGPAGTGAPVRARIIGSVMFGEDAYAESLHELCDELGIADRVEWRGFRDDVGAELAELDVLAHCSTTPEPFGQVVVEGMAAALPVVTTDVGGPAEVVEHGRTGLLVRPGDPSALAAVLRRLEGDPQERARLGAAAAAAAATYRDDVVAARFDAVFRQLHDCRSARRAPWRRLRAVSAGRNGHPSLG